MKLSHYFVHKKYPGSLTFNTTEPAMLALASSTGQRYAIPEAAYKESQKAIHLLNAMPQSGT